ncbi:MAG TPA: class I SAM-dependent methyltransferase [Candidatus Acidoferrales bacterium]|jgi:SAM-dependent methyltransferase|nr:class I SAM-dependent methyltransferase [Candidatus Acidoferrales bacterium]
MSNLKTAIKRIPVIGSGVKKLARISLLVRARRLLFRGSASYWEHRYRSGGTSGAGSYGKLAEFKATIINEFVERNNVGSVIEFGCGDGAQLELAKYPSYVGVDVATTSIERCSERFPADQTKRFYLAEALPESLGMFDLALSLDVIYHLVEDAVFDSYMQRLFGHSRRYVIVYASNYDLATNEPHVRHRKFTHWVIEKATGWQMTERVANRFPFDPRRPSETSFADFFLFARQAPAMPDV